MFLNIQIDLLILKTYDRQFTLTTKKSLHIIFNVPFQHKYGYNRDKRSGMESYPYSVKEGQRYIHFNPGHLFVQQPPKKGKRSRGSFKLLR